MKKYKLLKDLPNIKVGTIFESNGTDYKGEVYYFVGNTINISELTIRNNPDWFEEIKNELIKEPNYPKSWEELNVKKGWFIKNQYIQEVENHIKSDKTKDLFAIEKQAQSALAFAQLSQLHKAMIDEYNRVNNCDWKHDWNDVTAIGRVVRCYSYLTVAFEVTNVYNPLVFPTRELAKFSLTHHRELWKQYYQL